MKKRCLLLTLPLIGITAFTSCEAQTQETAPQPQELVVIHKNIRFCESTYPYQEGILIANFGTEQLNPLNDEEKGYIVYAKGNETNVLIPADGNLSAPKGMFIRDERLFICDVNKVVVYNLRALKEAPQVIQFPEGDLFINDLIANGDTLYASVTNSGKIYQMDINNLNSVGVPTQWVNIAGPNGIIIENGTMYISSYPADGNTTSDHVIYQISDLSNPIPQKFVDVPGQYDGIAMSADKKTMYVTNWSPAGVSAINMQSKQMTPLIIKEKLIGPADITVIGKSMYIPDLPNSRVIVYPL